MASYHLSVKTISRSAGRSATAAAAYRTASRIEDARTGQIHDYTRKAGVVSVDLLLPPGAPAWAHDRAALWNAAEQAETRKNSTVAREFEIALPAELPEAERRRLALDFAQEIVERHGCAVEVSIHAPSQEGDQRNHHAHLLCSTRKLEPKGFTAKTRELDDTKSGEVARWRARFAELQNERLQALGIQAQVDHRSLEAQAITDREPTQHRGPAITGILRRGETSQVQQRRQEEANARLYAARELGRLERELADTGQQIIDTSTGLAQALREREESQRHHPSRAEIEQGIAAARQAYQQYKAEQQAEQEKAEKARQRELERQPQPQKSQERGYSR